MGICKLHRGTGYSHLSRVKTLYPAAAPAQYSPIHNVSFRQKIRQKARRKILQKLH